MKINSFFAKRLQAPLYNHVWSWGAVGTKSNDVFLRIGSWALDHYDDGNEWVVLYKPEWDNESSPGAAERLRHIDLLRKGATGYAVIIEFRDDGKIASFDGDQLLRLGSPVTEAGTVYAEVITRLPIDDAVERSRSSQNRLQDILDVVRKVRNETERQAMISSRIGQGEFRESVLSLWDYKCALTGSATISAIRASHIKPWKTSTSIERLDPLNGIPLLATFDALFDRGLITFDRMGKLIVSPRLSLSERLVLGLNTLVGVKNIPRQSQQYLKYHREEVFD